MVFDVVILLLSLCLNIKSHTFLRVLLPKKCTSSRKMYSIFLEQPPELQLYRLNALLKAKRRIKFLYRVDGVYVAQETERN